MPTLKIMVILLVFIIGLAILSAIIMYIIDMTKKSTQLNKVFHILEYLSENFRLYFFTIKHEKLLFNHSRMLNLYSVTEGAMCD